MAKKKKVHKIENVVTHIIATLSPEDHTIQNVYTHFLNWCERHHIDTSEELIAKWRLMPEKLKFCAIIVCMTLSTPIPDDIVKEAFNSRASLVNGIASAYISSHGPDEFFIALCTSSFYLRPTSSRLHRISSMIELCKIKSCRPIALSTALLHIASRKQYPTMICTSWITSIENHCRYVFSEREQFQAIATLVAETTRDVYGTADEDVNYAVEEMTRNMLRG
ncbi:hypothetical protein Plim_0728 [Planctopirus limnophila DSM 3776]|uniref:Uncharacterized protein n=1 Tax=Planctopirus limnophila (strain ATCC 43296 / DSM 3776 / IFAM 1008 / Mu 290) TaxID=521674 RepID=D5SRP0_PLAL2|nr:hypothetical protein [Planctopirus limnophila]ADG66574.1 hypothetical protein Plim_0728 [Planctopirus limnophila DSM 3776]